jgi:phosphatidylglycerophosphate synthase
MEEPRGHEYLREVRARELQNTADRLTDFRALSAPFIGAAIAVTNSELLLTGIASGSAATDAADGIYARRAEAILGRPVSTDGNEADPAADRKFVYSMLGGLVVRLLRRGHPEQAAIVATNIAASIIRNDRMAITRSRIAEYNIWQQHVNPQNPELISSKAIGINKVKTLLHKTAGLVLISPLSRRPKIRTAAIFGLTVGTILGEIGERMFTHDAEVKLRAADPDRLI